MDVKRLLKGSECKMGIKEPGTRQQLHLKIGRTSGGFERKAFRLEFVEQAARMSNGLWKLRDWTLWRGWPTPKRKKNLLAALA
jgi:hypothetical protein